MGTFRAVVVDKTEAGYGCAFRELDDADLMDGDVTVRVTHSTVNYKDGLAVTGKAPVVRRFPMIPGIDFAGVVRESSNQRDFKPGDAVVLNGWGVGETHLGGYAERARVKGDWLIPLPAGFTAGAGHGDRHGRLHGRRCAVHRAGEARPDAGAGPVVVTGAAGGVGSVAITLLAKAGWHVIASTGRPQEADYLQGASARPRSSTAPSCPARQAARARSAGRRRSTASARTPSPTCCR